MEGAGHFSALPPNLGIPRLWAPGGLWRLGASERVGAGGEQLPQGGRCGEPNLHRPGLPDSSAGLKARTPPRPVTSYGLSGCGRGSSWSTWGEEVRAGLGSPPHPRVNRRFRTFFARPSPFLPLPSPGRVPVRPPFLPRAAGGACTSAGSGGVAEATLSPTPSHPRPPCHKHQGRWGSDSSLRPWPAGLRYRVGAAGRGLQGPDWRWTPSLATPREPRADSFHDVPVGAAAAPPAQRPGQ